MPIDPAKPIAQALHCPVCGKSGKIEAFSIDMYGNATIERVEHETEIALQHRNPKGQVFWTHHNVPLKVLLALRQQMQEALGRVDRWISEAIREGE